MSISLNISPTVLIALGACLYLLAALGYWFDSRSVRGGRLWARVIVYLLWPLILAGFGLAVLATLIFWPKDLRR